MKSRGDIYFRNSKFKKQKSKLTCRFATILMFTVFKRIFKVGFQNFWRNGWLSTATVSVMVLALSVVLGVILALVLSQALIINLQDKIDVSVYFKSGTLEEEIAALRNELAAKPDVKNVKYTSEQEALEKFKEKHKDNPVIIQSLTELDENPLEASLDVKATAPEKFAAIVNFLENKKYEDMISKVSYYENKEVIDRLTNVTSAIRKVGFVVSVALAAVAMLVSFNTIRIAIYTLRDEISIMRLVGAANWFIRGPFVVEGILYGVVSAAVTVLVFYPIVILITPYTDKLFPGSDLLIYFQNNLLKLWIILAAFGMAIGVVGGIIATRRYLKI